MTSYATEEEFAVGECLAYRDNFEHLEDELRRLDLRIRLRLASASLRNEEFPEAQAARTVYITREEVDWLLAPGAGGALRQPEQERAALERLSAEIDDRVRLSRREGVGLALPLLSELFGLSTSESAAVVVCLAPELRRKYDRLFAYLQDDLTRSRPSVDLVLELLYPEERDRWAARPAFAETAPLLRTGILRAADDPQSPSGSSGLARFLTLDPRICRFLLGSAEPDERLAGRARIQGPPAAAPADPALAESVWRLASHHLRHDDPDRRGVVLHLHGPAGAGKLELAARTSDRLGLALLSLDARILAGLGTEGESLLRPAFREGLLRGAALHLSGADVLWREDARPLLATLTAAVADYGWLVFLTGESAPAGGARFPGSRFQAVAVGLPDVPAAADLWRHALAGHTAEPQRWAAELADRYRLPPARIRAAVELAADHVLMEPEPRALALADVAAACRQQSNRELGRVAVKVALRSGWDDLVLPDDRLDRLREICDQVRQHHRVFGGWGFGAKLGHGKGLSVLFAGPPGTGKTMAAEVLAHDLGLDLYKVDLSGVVSKYIGETEKNLGRIFDEAATGNAILFFDEADALFGKRTEVSDAHDRYANIETSYLLQKIEEYEGVVVLATNLRQNLDDAFTRRIRFVVEFPFPDTEGRRRIWAALFPPEAPVSADVDFGLLAREFALPGANIRNIVLNAAFLAAAAGGVIERSHILRGTRHEFEKMGKLWVEPVHSGLSVPTS
ncbi:MAG: hypothetical protein QOI78_815 [Actinomycetota bacterium]|nr:hypothetical protein [Actinomycetota bacterium]